MSDKDNREAGTPAHEQLTTVGEAAGEHSQTTELSLVQEKILDSINDAIFVIDLETYTIILANEEAQTIFGHDTTGKKCYTILRGYNAPCEYCTYDQAARSPESESCTRWEFHNPVVGKDFLLTDKHITWPGGRTLKVESARDITEQKDREQDQRILSECKSIFLELKDITAIMKNVLELLIKLKDVQRVYFFKNYQDPEAGTCMQQILENVEAGIQPQISNESLQGLPYGEKFANLLETLQRREPYSRTASTMDENERSILLEAQQIRSVLIHPVFMRDKLWGFLGFDNCEQEHQWSAGQRNILATVSDYIGRKLVEDKLAKSNDLLKLIEENSPDPVWFIDFTGDELKFKYLSPSIQKLRGIYSSEIVEGGTSFEDLYPPESVRLIKKTLQEELERDNRPGVDPERHRILKLELLKNDGNTIPVEVTCRFSRDEEGNITGVTGSTRDISEREQAQQREKDLQERLRQAERLETMGRLAGGVAHDFNNLLTVIQSAAQFILEETAEADSVHTDAQDIMQAGKSAAELTSQLLAFGRQQTLETELIDVGEKIMRLNREMLRRLIPEDVNINIVVPKEDYYIWIDSNQLERILINLVKNASDAMPDGGNVTIQISKTAIDPYNPSLPPGQYAQISVADNGPGMEPHILDKIFEPFFTTKARGKGTGLGLASVYGTVKQSGGSINVTSTPGKGTKFTMLYPLVPEVEIHKGQKSENKIERNHSGSIVLIEDEPAVLKATNRVLERSGYTVYAFGSPLEALKFFQGDSEKKEISPDNIDAILCDIKMPDMNGPVLVEKIRALYPDIAVIFMTGYAYDDHALDHGQETIIQKPYSFNIITETLQRIIKAPQ